MSGLLSMVNTPLLCVVTKVLLHPRSARPVLSSPVALQGFTVKLRCSEPSGAYSILRISTSGCSFECRSTESSVTHLFVDRAENSYTPNKFFFGFTFRKVLC